MSMSFEEPINAEALAKIREMFGDPVAEDERNLLFDREISMIQSQMSDLARTAKQPVTVELHGQGAIKTMSDGTRYQVTPSGWRKVTE